MTAIRVDLIKKYLRPHRKSLAIGAISLIGVNLLSVAIPMEVSKIVDSLKEGFTFRDILNQCSWIVILATSMGLVRLISRQLVFGRLSIF